MDIGINARVFGVNTPDGSAQVGIHHTSNLLKDTDHSCILYGHPDCKQWFDRAPNNRSPLFRWSSQVFGVAWERTVLPTATRFDDLDVLFCPNANAPPVRSSNYATVMMIHHVGAEHGHSSIQRAYRKIMIPLGAYQSDAIVTVSEFSKKKIVDKLPVNEDRVHVIYNGIDDVYFDEDQGTPVDLPDEFILFVGSADERKNLKRLLSAYEQLESDIDLVVIGPQDSIAYGREDIDRDDIINLGYVTKEELRYVYEHATVFAYPSLYEGFGLPPVEAAACGTPVVTSNVSAIPEIMGDAAEYVDPYDVDSIRNGLEIIDDPERLDDLAEKGHQRAQRYTWEKATKRLIDVFKSVS
ncbi:glycosyltransferase family 4 protein [Haloferax volcanii]|uniref:Glycosyltransferase family 4 protein n=1 Tax=Haloferax volcanii TaxID=2246 RepID=A0A558GAK2_HALVO|nr:glycosyltransferase family 1 protein [Haloferax volcanii]TVT94768.1 glycosyltransferase family 4 protein [Haloferax volcanii]